MHCQRSKTDLKLTNPKVVFKLGVSNIENYEFIEFIQKWITK
jgi:hypothetical protein